MYKKDLPYSFTLGTAATLEVLIHKPQSIKKIYIHSKTIHNDIYQKLIKLATKYDIPLIPNDRIGAKISQKDNCYIVAEFDKYEEIIETNTNHLVLVNPSDAGNLGSIMRSMMGFSIRNLAIISPSVDHFHPKTIRASMGAIFGIHIQLFASFDDYQKKFSHQKLYPFMLNAKHNLASLTIDTPFTLIFGNEGSGLPATFESMGESVRIFHTKDIDSLNLPIAVSLALYEVTKTSFMSNL